MMKSSFLLFIHLLVGNVLHNDLTKANAKELEEIAENQANLWCENEMSVVANKNVYEDHVNKLGDSCVNQNVSNKNSPFNVVELNKDCLNSKCLNEKDNYAQAADSETNARRKPIEMKKIRIQRHVTRSPRSRTRSKRPPPRTIITTPKIKRKLKTKTTVKLFDLGADFDMDEFEKYLNENSHDKKVERDLRNELRMAYDERHVRKDVAEMRNISEIRRNRTDNHVENSTYQNVLQEYQGGNGTHDEFNRSSHSRREKSNAISLESKEVKQNSEKYDSYLTTEYGSDEEVVHHSPLTSHENKKTSKEVSNKNIEQDKDERTPPKNKCRVKRFAKRKGKNKKKPGGRGGGFEFEFNFGKQKNTKNKYKQGKKGKGGGGGGGGFGGGFGGVKKKKKGQSSSGEYMDIGDFFQMGNANDDDDDEDDDSDDYFSNADYYSSVDSEEELSHRGGGRGGRNYNKKTDKMKSNKNQKHQNNRQQQNQQEGDGIDRPNLVLTEIKDDEDHSIFKRRNVKVVSNKKGAKEKPQTYHHVYKGPILRLEYLNKTNFQSQKCKSHGIFNMTRNKKEEKKNIPKGRVRRFANGKKSKKPKSKNTKRAHKGDKNKNGGANTKTGKKKIKADKKRRREYSDSSKSDDISREKLKITEIKSEGHDEPNEKMKSKTEEQSRESSEESVDENVKVESDSDKSSDTKTRTIKRRMKEENSIVYVDENSQSKLEIPDRLNPKTKARGKGKYGDINEALGVDIEKLKKKYEVDTEEAKYEIEEAKGHLANQKKRKKSNEDVKKKRSKKTTKKKPKQRRPPTKHTTKKRREKKKVYDYSAEWGDKDRKIKTDIKELIQELNVTSRCEYCGSGKASLQHVLAGCKMALYFGFYSRRHDRVLKMIRNAFELALDQANRTADCPPSMKKKDKISAENNTAIKIEFLTRLRYILSHKPAEANTTKKRGRKSKTTSTFLNHTLNNITHAVSLKCEDNETAVENGRTECIIMCEESEQDDETTVPMDRSRLVESHDDGVEGVDQNINHDVDLNQEINQDKVQKEDPREINSYEFKLNLEKHTNVFIEPDFSRENPLHPFISSNKVRSILGLADDWKLYSDNRDSRYSFPVPELQPNTSLLKPDLLLISPKLRYMLILELTIPWDFNILRQSTGKSSKYKKLIRALNEAKYNVHFHTVQVGLTGYIGPELEVIFRSIGLDRPTRKRYLADITNSTLQSSLSIWNRKQERKWKFWIFWKKRNQEKYKRKHARPRKGGGQALRKS